LFRIITDFPALASSVNVPLAHSDVELLLASITRFESSDNKSLRLDV